MRVFFIRLTGFMMIGLACLLYIDWSPFLYRGFFMVSAFVYVACAAWLITNAKELAE